MNAVEGPSVSISVKYTKGIAYRISRLAKSPASVAEWVVHLIFMKPQQNSNVPLTLAMTVSSS